jgi:outer membrane lipoprotein SlyB
MGYARDESTCHTKPGELWYWAAAEELKFMVKKNRYREGALTLGGGAVGGTTGASVGAAVGFFVAGPVGVAAGMWLGTAVGTMLGGAAAKDFNDRLEE